MRHPDFNELYLYPGDAIGDGPKIHSCTAYHGDRVVLIAHGITRVLDNQRIAELATSAADVDSAASILADAAIEHGAGDDVTCVVIDILN
ncbi:MAG: protein phosphatase 2C family protein [Fuerstiella sp.]|nr:protein phosphatase 2C family protein [Fuerstiella sp.]MCP4855846.1 protein phosphatase 2C family protein [Fuerstiella sp.]